MPRGPTQAFICYRRSTLGSSAAGRLASELRRLDIAVAIDVNHAESGLWKRRVARDILASSHVLVVITDGDLDKCANEGDAVLAELNIAREADIPIVPVLLDPAGFAKAKVEAPQTVSSLFDHQAYYTRHESYQSDVADLADALRRSSTIASGMVDGPASGFARLISAVSRFLTQYAPQLHTACNLVIVGVFVAAVYAIQSDGLDGLTWIPFGFVPKGILFVIDRHSEHAFLSILSLITLFFGSSAYIGVRSKEATLFDFSKEKLAIAAFSFGLGIGAALLHKERRR